MNFRNKNYRRLMLMIGMVFCCVVTTRAQIPGQFTELFELVKIAERYRHAPDLSFNVQIKYADSVNVDSAVEQMTANYKLHNGQFYTYIDSTEIVQGTKYSIRVNHFDSVISIANRNPYPDVMNMPVTDTLYWSQFAQSISGTVVNDSVRTITVRFKPGSVYTSYEVRYNPLTYRLLQVKCYMPADTPGTDSDLFPSGKALISFVFSGYNTNQVSAGWFSEEKFIRYVNGQFQAQAPYVGYFIENLIQ